MFFNMSKPGYHPDVGDGKVSIVSIVSLSIVNPKHISHQATSFHIQIELAG